MRRITQTICRLPRTSKPPSPPPPAPSKAPTPSSSWQARGWAFYGHRQQLYRETKPHRGYSLLKEWGEAMPQGHFVYTSNVDGHFQFARFQPERLVECHGNIHFQKWLMSRDLIEPVGEKRTGSHRPAELFRLKPAKRRTAFA